MKIATTLFLFVVVGCTWREILGTCVFESDFGFTLNCAFKKSGLFRVRNLGGVKGYLGLGFSIGDELGFRESLTSLETSKRRSVQTRRGSSSNLDVVRQIGQKQGVPPFKPLPPGTNRPMSQQPERQKLVVQQNSTAIKTLPAPSSAVIQEQKQQQIMQKKQQQDALALQLLKQQRIQQQEAMRQQHILKLQEQQKLKDMVAQQQQIQQQQMLAMHTKRMQMLNGGESGRLPNIIVAIPPSGNVPEQIQSGPKPVIGMITPVLAGLPPFAAMPQSAAQLTDRIGSGPTYFEESDNEVSKDSEFSQLPIPGEEAALSVNKMTLMSLQGNNMVQPMQSIRPSLPTSLPSLAPLQGMETSLRALAEASNITLEALEAAILLRQQQLMQKHEGQSTTTTTTTTTVNPNLSTNDKNKYNPGPTKVMNAPREYYPVGYDKNFDDNFASRVDLPDTSFYCGDQKHFPGLYADEDLGCMVFHVCALTDDGLIMKSFLCPESTLFDQTILKCNWWFYVDCKTSKTLYDSNIPISKSYQLMKALAFFSAYKNHDNGTVVQESGPDGI